VRVAQAFLISTWALDIVILFFTAVFLVSADTTTTVDDADGQRAPSPAPASGGGGGGGAATPAASTAAQSGYHSPTEPAMDGYPEAVLIGIYGAVILMPVWSLCGYHAFLIAQGETTKERIVANRHKEAERDGAGLRATRSAGQEGRQAQRQAEGMSCLGHWLTVCGPTPPSQLGDMRQLLVAWLEAAAAAAAAAARGRGGRLPGELRRTGAESGAGGRGGGHREGGTAGLDNPLSSAFDSEEGVAV
jgi:hypothetical protein